MKTSIVAIALAATVLSSVNALKCEKSVSGSLASWEEINLENGHVQHYAMEDGKLAKSKKREEFDFYACEAPAKFHKNIKANRDHGAEKVGVIKTKDGTKGVAFDTEGGQGTSLKNPDDYRNSYSFFLTEKVDASCVYMNP